MQKKLLLGLNYVEKNLIDSIGEGTKARLNVYLIPSVYGLQNIIEIIEKRDSAPKNIFGIVKAYRTAENTEKIVKGYHDFSKKEFYYVLSILFGEKRSSHFAFQYLINDVPSTRFYGYRDSADELSRELADIFNEDYSKWYLGFENILSIFPLRVQKGKVLDWKAIVELFDALLTGSYYDPDRIIRQAIIFARILRYGTFEGYNLKPPTEGVDINICRAILKYNLLLKLMVKLGVNKMSEKHKEKQQVFDVKTG